LLSIFLVTTLDSFTKKFISKWIKNRIKPVFYKIIKYSYIITLPILFAVFLRTFFFDVYFVPSSSMERTLFPDDYVLVNKISYGVKIPNHLHNVPVIGSLFKPLQNEFNLYRALSSLNQLKREDIVVFKAVNDTDEFLIKRIIGMPSDTLQIKQTKVFINSVEQQEKEMYTHKYVWKDKRSIFKSLSNNEYSQLSNIEKNNYKRNITLIPSFLYSIFPFEKQELWTRDNYGALIIPKKGMSITLNKENLVIYGDVLHKFEDINIELLENEIKKYVFKNDYYFMMGDNRHNSLDSRSFGFVPESYIQGKMIKAFSKKRISD